MKVLFTFFFFLGAMAGMAVEETALQTETKIQEGRVKYRPGKELNFENLFIQGQLKRPDIQIVTGNESDSINGLLRLRENFADRMAIDFGESVP